jgi:hypothetical protein
MFSLSSALRKLQTNPLCTQEQIIKLNNVINSNEILWNTFVAGDLRANINVLQTKAAGLLYRSKEGCGGTELEKDNNPPYSVIYCAVLWQHTAIAPN